MLKRLLIIVVTLVMGIPTTIMCMAKKTSPIKDIPGLNQVGVPAGKIIKRKISIPEKNVFCDKNTSPNAYCILSPTTDKKGSPVYDVDLSNEIDDGLRYSLQELNKELSSPTKKVSRQLSGNLAIDIEPSGNTGISIIKIGGKNRKELTFKSSPPQAMFFDKEAKNVFIKVRKNSDFGSIVPIPEQEILEFFNMLQKKKLLDCGFNFK